MLDKTTLRHNHLTIGYAIVDKAYIKNIFQYLKLIGFINFGVEVKECVFDHNRQKFLLPEFMEFLESANLDDLDLITINAVNKEPKVHPYFKKQFPSYSRTFDIKEPHDFIHITMSKSMIVCMVKCARYQLPDEEVKKKEIDYVKILERVLNQDFPIWKETLFRISHLFTLTNFFNIGIYFVFWAAVLIMPSIVFSGLEVIAATLIGLAIVVAAFVCNNPIVFSNDASFLRQK